MKIREPIEKKLIEKDFEGALKKIVELKPSIDKFFDHVLVMDKNETLRKNRLNLLFNISLLTILTAFSTSWISYLQTMSNVGNFLSPISFTIKIHY